MCENFRGFDIRGLPYVYINREIQGMPVMKYTSLKMAILLHKTVLVNFSMAMTVMLLFLFKEFDAQDEQEEIEVDEESFRSDLERDSIHGSMYERPLRPSMEMKYVQTKFKKK